jgi:ankyrin repeat protein
MAASTTSKLLLPLEFLPLESQNLQEVIEAKKMADWFGEDRTDLNKASAMALRLDRYQNIALYVVDDENGQTVLHKAAEKADAVALKVFVERNCLNDIPDANGDTPFALLVERYLESENTPVLRDIINIFIKKGVRLDYPNKDGITPMMRMVAGGSDMLFHQCLVLPSVPLAHALVHLCDVSDEMDELVLERLSLALTQLNLRMNLIVMILAHDFSEKPKTLGIMLGKLVEDTPYSPLWLDALRKDKVPKSIFCKMNILAGKNVDEPMRKHFFGLGYDNKEEYQALSRWFKCPKLPPPNTPVDVSEKPVRTSSWGHPVRSTSAQALRKRGDSAAELGDYTTIAQLSKMIHGNDAQKALGLNRFKANILKYIVSKNEDDIHLVQEILRANPRLILQTYKGVSLITQTIQARCNAMAIFLLEHGAPTDVWDNQYNTPLHHALLNEVERPNPQSVSILRLLIKKGANINALNLGSKSPLDLLLDLNRPDLFEPFLDEEVDWISFVEGGMPRTENQLKSILFLLKHKKISPKTLLASLLKRSFDEKEKFPQQLLRETLHQCEKMEPVEVAALAMDGRSESLLEKVRVFKSVPHFYVEVLHFLFQQSGSSGRLLTCMLEEMDENVAPDYDYIFKDEDKNSRRTKIQALMNLSLLQTQRRADQLASGKALSCKEALLLGFAQLLPDPASINWCIQLKDLAQDCQTLTSMQISLLKKVLPVEPVALKPLVSMLFMQDLRRSDPLHPGPYEIMLEIALSNLSRMDRNSYDR